MAKYSILRNRVFLNFFGASLIGLFGEGIFNLACLVTIQKETGSVMAIGYMIMITMLPSVLVAPFGGVLIDRLNKAKIAIWCNAVRLVCIGIIPLFVILGWFSVHILYVSVFLSYLAFHLLTPTTESMLKEVLSEDEYMQGVSLTQAAWQVGLLGSAVIAGILIEKAGFEITFLSAALTYLAGALLFLKIKHLYAVPVRSELAIKFGFRNYLSDIREGWRYLLKNKGVLLVSLAACISFPYFSSINILIAPFNDQMLDGNSVTLGLVESGAGIGSLVSAGVCLLLSKRKSIPVYLIASTVLLMISTYLFSRSAHYMSAFGLYIAIGLFIGNVKILSKTLVYQVVEKELVGRTMTTISMISLGSATAFSFLIGSLGENDIAQAYLVVVAVLIAPILLTIAGQYYIQREFRKTKLPHSVKEANFHV